MEIFGLPVVLTVRDMLSLGGLAIVFGLWVLTIPVVFVLWVAKLYIKWREKGCG